MATQNKLNGWPAPWSPIDKATAGALIGVSRDTMERTTKRIAKGGPPPKVRKPVVLDVCGIFAGEAPGNPVLAQRIYEVLKVNPATLSGPFIQPVAPPSAPAKKKPGGVPSQAELAAMSVPELDKALKEAVDRAHKRTQGGRVPMGRVKAIADELTHKRGKPPGGMIHGQPLANIDLNKIETWGFVGVFAAQAAPGDLWPFVLPQDGGRPIDLLSATVEQICYGWLVALTLEEWLALLAAAVQQEKAAEASLVEEQDIGRAAESSDRAGPASRDSI